MITPIKEDFGVGDLGIGVLLSLALLFNGLITVPAGYLADRWNRTRAIGHTVVGWSALDCGGRRVGRVPDARRHALRARVRPGDHRAVGRQPHRRLLPAGEARPGVLGPAGDAARWAPASASASAARSAPTWGWRPALVVVAIPGFLVALLVYRLREPKRGTADLIAATGSGEIEHADEHVNLFEHGFRQFLRDMIDGLRADMRTIISIRTMRYALVGVAALLFAVTALAAWLPQYYERQMHMAEGTGEALFMFLIILGGIPGVLVGGRVADRYAPRMQGGRLALPAIFIFVGTFLLTRRRTSCDRAPTRRARSPSRSCCRPSASSS